MPVPETSPCDSRCAPGGREPCGDETPLTHKKDNYSVYVRDCGADDIVEIDTFREPQALDSVYVGWGAVVIDAFGLIEP